MHIRARFSLFFYQIRSSPLTSCHFYAWNSLAWADCFGLSKTLDIVFLDLDSNDGCSRAFHGSSFPFSDPSLVLTTPTTFASLLYTRFLLLVRHRSLAPRLASPQQRPSSQTNPPPPKRRTIHRRTTTIRIRATSERVRSGKCGGE